MSVREDIIKWAKANKITAGIIAYLAVGFIFGILVLIVVLALPDSDTPSTTSSNTVQTDTPDETAKTSQNTTQPTEQPAPEQPVQQESVSNSLTEIAEATCKAHVESQVYVTPASVSLVNIDEDTSDITVMALVKDGAGEYFAYCVLSPSGRTVKDFKVQQ